MHFIYSNSFSGFNNPRRFAMISPHLTSREVGRTQISSRVMIIHKIFVFKTTTLALIVCLPHTDISKSIKSIFFSAPL